jgi:hypothetical protein
MAIGEKLLTTFYATDNMMNFRKHGSDYCKIIDGPSTSAPTEELPLLNWCDANFHTLQDQHLATNIIRFLLVQDPIQCILW